MKIFVKLITKKVVPNISEGNILAHTHIYLIH